MNQLSAFIDCSTVYGSNEKHLNLLKAKDKMHLRMQNSRHKDLLPSVQEISDQDLSTCESDIIDKFGGLNKNSSFKLKVSMKEIMILSLLEMAE